jgi:uncharacterized Zn-binding protein involved in type VI secretion
MPGVSRDAGTDSAGGPIIQGSPDVFTNGDPTVRVGDAVAGHAPGIHAAPVMAAGSGNVFTNNISTVRAGDPATCGDLATGSGDVFAGDDIDQDIPSVRIVIDADEEDVTNPGAGAAIFQAAVNNGTISQREATVKAFEPTGKTDTAPARPSAPLSKDCGDIESIFTDESPPSGDDIDKVVLQGSFTIGSLTRKPSVIFDNPLRSSTGGLTVAEIACNLKLLLINCIIPIRNQYPNAFVTNTWRPFQGNPRSQHPKGQAADIQFRGVSKAAYYDIAQWIKDNVSYDQLLLEYKTTGSGLPWIHISFNKDQSRAQVLTLLNNATYSQGLTQLA